MKQRQIAERLWGKETTKKVIEAIRQHEGFVLGSVEFTPITEPPEPFRLSPQYGAFARAGRMYRYEVAGKQHLVHWPASYAFDPSFDGSTSKLGKNVTQMALDLLILYALKQKKFEDSDGGHHPVWGGYCHAIVHGWDD